MSMSSPKPIRVGFIGLSQNGGWAPIAHLPYFQSELGKKNYKIVAVCNSSVESAKSSIAKFGLEECKAYGSPDEMAKDPDIDLVICVTRVTLHASVLRPFLKAGRRIATESPLGRSFAETSGLINDAKAAGIPPKDLLVILEEPRDAGVRKVKQLVEAGTIGRLLHSSIECTGLPLGDTVAKEHEYATQHENGAWQPMVLHELNAIISALGPLQNCSGRAISTIPKTNIVDAAQDMKVIKTVSKDVPDHIVLAGQFKPTEAGKPGASFAMQTRTDSKFGDEPSFVWRVMGEKGQLRIVAPSMFLPEWDDGTKFEHFDYATKEIRDVIWRPDLENDADERVLAGLPAQGRSIARTYEAFAKGEHVGTTDWECGLELFKLVDGVVNEGEYQA